MGFQKKVYVTQAIGKAGTLARNLPAVHKPYVVEGDGLYAGAFAFAGTTADQVKGTATAGTAPKGVALFARYQFNDDLDNNLLINEGEEVAVYENGFIFAKTGTASVGQKVLVDATTGAIGAGNSATNASAGTLTVAGVTYSGFTSISSGSIDFIVDGETVALTGLDFHSAASLSDVAGVFDTALTSVADCAVANTNNLVFTSKTTGATSNVSIASTSGSVLTALGSAGTSVDGKNAMADSGWVIDVASDVNGVAVIRK